MAMVTRLGTFAPGALLCLVVCATSTSLAGAFASNTKIASGHVATFGRTGLSGFSKTLIPRRSTLLPSEAGDAPITTASDIPVTSVASVDAKDGDEWEYEEFEDLAESDFIGSEWKVGTVWNDKTKQIKETWARLIIDEKSDTNIVVWGDGAKGKWNFDLASQFLSMSKDSFGGWFGKKIWAGSTDDYYFLSGTVRGWNPTAPASVLAQWQAKRLGVDPDEAGVAPWFEESTEDSEVEAGGDPSTEESEDVGQT